MVHRPTDSRLLANLLAAEKEYKKQLLSVVEFSQLSLASFSAYASASPPPTSGVILAVAGSLAGANDALQKYSDSIEEWREQLRAVKELEEEVKNITRDREILVTRLIKASKQQKPTRDSFITSQPGSPIVKGEVNVNSKLNMAQSELQACEAYLANKERELDALRFSSIRVGLHDRCKAMAECGRAWGGMGEEGIRALEDLDVPNGHIGSPLSSPPSSKPLPDHSYKLPSDSSSILPSQSASQIALVSPSGSTAVPKDVLSSPNPTRLYALHIPPAHSISELALPAQHIDDSPVDDDSSSSSHEVGPVEVYENERFASSPPFSIRSQNKGKGKPRSPVENSHIHFNNKPALPTGSPTVGKEKERKTSSTVFGGLANFFHKNSPSKGRWQTMGVAKEHTDSDEDSIRYLAVASQKPVNGDAKQHNLSSGGRLKKPKNRAVTVDESTFSRPPAVSFNNPSSLPAQAGSSSKGKGRAVVMDLADVSGPSSKDAKSTKPRRTLTRRPSSSQPHLPLPIAGGASLSRDSSLSKRSQLSSMSAPPAQNLVFRPGSAANTHVPDTRRRRTTSATTPGQKSATRSIHARSGSLGVGSVNPTPAQSNLMSIVEDAVRQNREARILLNPNSRLESVKAPASASVTLSRESHLAQALLHPPPPPTSVKSEAKVQVQQPKPVVAAASKRDILTSGTEAPLPPTPDSVTFNKPFPSKLPLKSALRNPSRTPSPLNRSPTVVPILVSSPPQMGSSLVTKSQDDDIASESSYETVHETFDFEPEEKGLAEPSHAVNGADNSDLSHSTSSTANGTSVTVRRKSVRMSLPPMFSVTPPAVEEWESDKEQYPWTSRIADPNEGWTTRNGHARERDIWDDSSEEDEEYSRARKLLSKISGRH